MNVNEAVRIHLASLQAGHADFDDTLKLIRQHFEFQPTGFNNGPLRNEAGENAGSCQVFALGQYCNLGESDTLRLFAQHYEQVLGDPTGDSHGNIRQFISTGWSGIHFDAPPLRALGDTQASTPENSSIHERIRSHRYKTKLSAEKCQHFSYSA